MVLINFSDNKKEAIPAFGRLHHTIKHYFQQRYERSDIWGCNNFIRNFPWWSDEHSQVKVTLSLFFKPLCPHFWHWRFQSRFSKLLTLSWQRPLSYKNQSIDLLRKSVDWFLYDNGLRHERVRYNHKKFHIRRGLRISFKALQIHVKTQFWSYFFRSGKEILS